MASSLGSSIQSSPWSSWRSIWCNLFLRCVCRDLMNCGFMIRLSMNLIWVSSDLSYAWFHPCNSLRIVGFVWPPRSMILAMGEVLGFGFIPCDDLSQWQKGKQGTHRVVSIKGNKMGFYRRYEIVHLHRVILLKALLCSYELNTLDACWIAVDVWSNSCRCRKYRSTCFGRDAYRYDRCHW